MGTCNATQYTNVVLLRFKITQTGIWNTKIMSVPGNYVTNIVAHEFLILKPLDAKAIMDNMIVQFCAYLWTIQENIITS